MGLHAVAVLARQAAAGLVVLAVCALGPAAAADNKRLAPGVATLEPGTVLLMPSDIELFSISGGGVSEPRADWTAAARGHVDQAIRARLQGLGMAAAPLDDAAADRFAEEVALHTAVARSILRHHVGGGPWALPSKQGRLDWSLGTALQSLQAQGGGARYALFVRIRDSYASAERKAALVGMALFGVVGTGGAQFGYASLVDLQSGQVLWFNTVGRMSGDIRDAQPATETVGALLADFPAARR